MCIFALNVRECAFALFFPKFEKRCYACFLEVTCQKRSKRCQSFRTISWLELIVTVSETWKTPNKINKMIDVFHRRCLRSILGISWRDHVTNDEVLARTGQATLHDTVATRRRRLVGHTLRLPTTRPASLAIIWRPRWQEEGWKTKEDMSRHTEVGSGHTGCWLEWRERYC